MLAIEEHGQKLWARAVYLSFAKSLKKLFSIEFITFC